MIPKRRRMHRQMIVLGSIAGAANELTQGLWRDRGHKRWLIPLALFLCLTGALLVLAVTVEALAPFIYPIF
ncbi:DUF5989 family protein [Phenylobacterium sp. LjRoot225]|uniref:DUF5989 family protein n=1 Tax=Phenylobacterium sp. LjRoot225 TaxID=3342285 RepID=UPI003ECDA06F